MPNLTVARGGQHLSVATTFSGLTVAPGGDAYLPGVWAIDNGDGFVLVGGFAVSLTGDGYVVIPTPPAALQADGYVALGL